MAVLRKEKKDSFTVIDNAIFKNTKLSLKAKGLLCQMLSLPDGWEYSVKGLEMLSSDRYSAITSGLKELEEAGYLRREQLYDNGRFAGYEYVISEVPNSDFPFSENPISENTISENQTQLNTKESITKESITKSSSLRSEDIYRDLPENLKEALKDFEDMRKLKKKPMTNKARTMLLNKLESLSDGNDDLKIAILNQSIENAWTSVYEIKEQNNGRKGADVRAGDKDKGSPHRRDRDIAPPGFKF